MRVSVTEPLGLAITRATQITFGPFDLGKWFVLGFSAWLATLGDRKGFNFSYQNHDSTHTTTTGAGTDTMQHVWHWIDTHLPLIITLSVVIAIMVIAVGLLMSWLRSRHVYLSR